MSEELKPCPFCGSEIEFIPSHVEEQNFVNSASIICRKCRKEYVGATFIVPGEIESEELTNNILINWWNTRPLEDEKDKEIAELKAALKAFIKWDKDYPVGYNPMTGLHEFNSLITNAKFLLWGLEKTSKDTDVPADPADINVGSIKE